MSQPNVELRAARAALLMSQDDLARAVRAAGERTGEPNGCTKRDVQRWEAGQVQMPRGDYARALEAVTGLPIENLGFEGAADRRYRVNRREALAIAGAAGAVFTLPEGQESSAGPLTGIWRSRYEYVSSGRGGKTFASEHYCLMLHRGARLQLRSLPKTAEGKVMMDLTVNGATVTGTWTEQTDQSGYYAGSVYHGAIQMLIDPTGHRMTGKWAGFGRDYEVNTGPWTLTLETADTSKEAIAKYNGPVEPAN